MSIKLCFAHFRFQYFPPIFFFDYPFSFGLHYIYIYNKYVQTVLGRNLQYPHCDIVTFVYIYINISVTMGKYQCDVFPFVEPTAAKCHRYLPARRSEVHTIPLYAIYNFYCTYSRFNHISIHIQCFWKFEWNYDDGWSRGGSTERVGIHFVSNNIRERRRPRKL